MIKFTINILLLSSMGYGFLMSMEGSKEKAFIAKIVDLKIERNEKVKELRATEQKTEKYYGLINTIRHIDEELEKLIGKSAKL